MLTTGKDHDSLVSPSSSSWAVDEPTNAANWEPPPYWTLCRLTCQRYPAVKESASGAETLRTLDMAGASVMGGFQYLDHHMRETAALDADQRIGGSRLREMRAKLRAINHKLGPQRQAQVPLRNLPREQRLQLLQTKIKAMKRKLARSKTTEPPGNAQDSERKNVSGGPRDTGETVSGSGSKGGRSWAKGSKPKSLRKNGVEGR